MGDIQLSHPQDVPLAVARAFPNSQAVGALFAENASFVVADGTVLTGRAEIVNYFDRLLAGADKWGTSLSGVRSVAEVDWQCEISPSTAIVRTHGGMIMAGETSVAEDRRGVQTWVVIRENGTWRAAAYQNTRIV
jgi:uncharacterized protein (TIGR02246 family)